ncbi:MAG: hypothetical protein ACYTBV_17265, partial [Planctomycetota bacterium]
ILDGYFTVDIPVPIEAFEGSARLIEIGVRPGILEDPNAYTFMEPLQKVMPTPYALYSVKTGFSEDSNSLDGLDSSDFASSFHLHSGEDIATGTVAEARIDAAVARDTEIIPEVLANDGSGSGLDADMLDGLHGTSYFILNQSETVSGRPYFHGGTTGSTPPFYVDSTYRVSGLNADYLDGYHASSFVLTSADYGRSGVSGTLFEGTTPIANKYVNVTGDNMTGTLGINKSIAGVSYGIDVISSSSGSSALGGDFSALCQSTSTGSVYGTRSYGYHYGTIGTTYGMYSSCYGSDTGDSYGINSTAYKHSSDTGGYAYGGYFVGDNDRTGGTSYGVYAKATGLNGPRYGLYSDVDTSGTTPSANLGLYTDVTNNRGSTYGVYSYTTAGSGNTSSIYGLYSYGNHFGTSGTAYGMYSYMYGSDAGDSYGIYAGTYKSSSDTGGLAYGGRFYASNYIGYSYGVYGEAAGYDGRGYAVYAKSTYNTDGWNNYGVYSETAAGSSGVGAFGFYGDVDSTSSFGAYGMYLDVDKTSTTATGNMYGADVSVYHSGTSGTVYGVDIYANPSNTGAIYGLYSYIYSAGTTSGTKYAGYFSGNVHVAGSFTASAKAFVQPHKTDPTKEIVYISVEGPEHRVVMDGKASLQNGIAVIAMPEHWQQVAAGEDITVNLTPMGKPALLYTESATISEVVVKVAEGGPQDVTFSYHITGLREGFESHEPIQDNIHFTTQDKTVEEFEGTFAGDSLDRRAIREMLISNGTLTETGELNIDTAESLGWEVTSESDESSADLEAHGLTAEEMESPSEEDHSPEGHVEPVSTE